MNLPLLVLALGILGAEPPGGLEAARAAVAAGDLSEAVRLLARPSPTEAAYAEALGVALAHEEQFRLAYHTAGRTTDVSNAVLERLRKDSKLEKTPELVAQATRLAVWQGELDVLRAGASTAAERGDLGSARLLYERVRAHPLARGTTAEALRKEADAALVELVRRASAEASRRAELEVALDDGAPPVLPLPHVAAGELGATQVPGVDAAKQRAKYEDALEELRRQALLVRLAYQSGGKEAAEKLIEALKKSEPLRPYPVMTAHAYRLERWVQQEHLADWPREFLDDTRAAGLSVLELASIAGAVLVLGALVRWLQRWRASRSTLAELRVFELAAGAGPLSPSEVHALRFRLVFEEARVAEPIEGRSHDSNLGESLPRWESLAGKDLDSFASHLPEGGKLSIGPLAIPLRAVWALMVRVVVVPRYRWMVVIRPGTDTVAVSLSVLDASDGKSQSWKAVASGAEAATVDEAFRKLALQYGYGCQPSKTFASPDAFVAFHDGVRALAGGALAEARNQLDAARRLDPAHARTKLVLATVLRRSGDREGARALLADVAACLATAKDSTVTQELNDEVRFQIALLDAQSHRANSVWKAVWTFEALAKGKSSVAVEARACLLDTYVTLASDRELKRGDVEDTRLTRKAEELAKFFASPVRPEGFDLGAQAWNEARGYALHALGKLHLHKGDFKNAMAALQRALLCSPELLPAYVAVARTARLAKGQILDWEGVAEHALRRALALNPGDPAVNYQFGHFHLERSAPRLDEAARHFATAGEQWAAARYQLGRLKGQSEPLEGLKLIGQAIQKSGRMPSYYAKGIRECLASALKATLVAVPGSPPAPPGADLVDRLAQAMRGSLPHSTGWLKGASEQLRNEVAEAEPGMKAVLEGFARSLISDAHSPAA